MIKRINSLLLYLAFFSYVTILLWIIGFKFNADWLPVMGKYFRDMPLDERAGNNIIPFYDMIENGFYFNLDYFMNIIIYMPLGAYLIIFGKNKYKCLISVLIIMISSIVFELVQLVTGFGGCDGADFVCNTVGGLLGMIICFFIIRSKKKNVIINIYNLVFIILCLPVAIYAIINTIENWHLYKI